MAPYLLAIAITVATWSAPTLAAQPSIEIWHSDTVWAGQGMCSASFSIDAGWQDSPLENLQITIEAIDAKGNKLVRNTLEYEGPIGDSNATRYDTTFFESEAVCHDDLRIAILGANAMVDGKKVSVIVTPRAFKPFEIIMAK